MELLGNVGNVESHFGPFGASVSVCGKIGARFPPKYHRLRNHFGYSRWYSKVTRLLWKLVSVHLEIVLILTQGRCTICAEHTIDSEIVLDALDGTRISFWFV
jgi:hypothetical protein